MSLSFTESKPVYNVVDKNQGTRLAHYADSPSVVRGYVEGTTVEALCGKIFVPSMDPEKLDVCPDCRTLGNVLFLF